MRNTTTGRTYEDSTTLPPILLQLAWTTIDEAYCSPCGTYKITFHNQQSIWKKNVGLLHSIKAPSIVSQPPSRKRYPDEAILIENITDGSKRLIVVEKKFQKTAGSADEKLATIYEKTLWLERLFEGTGIKTEYMFLLSEWFEHPRYDDYRLFWKIVNLENKVMYRKYDLKMLGL